MSASSADPAPTGTIADWCLRHLGSHPVHSFITSAPASQLWGFELADGRVVAVKVRRDSIRIAACEAAHQLVHDHGIDCPALLAGPAPIGDSPGMVVTAEKWRSDGAIWPTDDPAGCYGRLQARVIAACAGLDPALLAPPPLWLAYDHADPERLWAPAANAAWDPERICRELPPGFAATAGRARQRLLAATLPEVVGHAELNGVHIRWLDGANGLPAPIVHGWEELAARPEAVLVGCLAANYNELPDESRIAPIAQGRRVLAAYQSESGRSFTDEEVEVAWAASLWVGCYNAALEHLRGAPGQVTHQIMIDGASRLQLAGC
jgi:hypothetical protein